MGSHVRGYMSRKRIIDPNIWEDPNFASLSREARLLFIGLISNADDEGYLRGHAGALKRLVFGFDDDMSTSAIQLLITELQEKLRHLNFYEVDGQVYIHICSWNKYQKQQKDRIVATLFPKCSKCIADAKQVLTEVKLSKEKLSKENNIIDESIEDEKEDEKSSLDDVLQDIESSEHIKYDYQLRGLEIWEELSAPAEKKSSFIKVVRDENPGVINAALSFARDYPVPQIKWKMFFKQLSVLKKKETVNV